MIQTRRDSLPAEAFLTTVALAKADQVTPSDPLRNNGRSAYLRLDNVHEQIQFLDIIHYLTGRTRWMIPLCHHNVLILRLFLIVFIVAIEALTATTSAQECAVSAADQQSIMASLIRSRALNSSHLRTDDTVFVPIRFFLTGRDDGSGSILVRHVLQEICEANELFAKSRIQFYLRDLHFINSSIIYSEYLSIPAEVAILQEKIYDAINVFTMSSLILNFGSAGGIYRSTYGLDYVAITHNSLVGRETILAHEIGHFLGLPHTFRGWDVVGDIRDWGWDPEIHGNPVGLLAPDSLTLNEWVNQGCDADNMGDGICDTPADYLLVRSSPDCFYSGNAMDPGGTLLEPMLENVMNYGSSCPEYSFTSQQMEIMRLNLHLREREYIRSDYIPNQSLISEAPRLVSPANGTEIAADEAIIFDWEPVQGADRYLFEVSTDSNFSRIVGNGVRDTFQLTLSDSFLDPGAYYWRVMAFGEYQTCGIFSPGQRFTVGQTTGLQDDPAGSPEVLIYPNPVIGNTIHLDIRSPYRGPATISLCDLSGQTILVRQEYLSEEHSNFQIQMQKPVSGMYLFTLSTDREIVHRKVLFF